MHKHYFADTLEACRECNPAREKEAQASLVDFARAVWKVELWKLKDQQEGREA